MIDQIYEFFGIKFFASPRLCGEFFFYPHSKLIVREITAFAVMTAK
jgi:hypothetical protein